MSPALQAKLVLHCGSTFPAWRGMVPAIHFVVEQWPRDAVSKAGKSDLDLTQAFQKELSGGGD